MGKFWDFIILDADKKPNFWLSSLLLLGGVSIVGFLGYRVRHWFNKPLEG